MNWGSITPDFSKDNELVHVFNHLISTKESLDRTIEFIIGKIIWCNLYLKQRFSHIVIIDDVGQSVTDNIMILSYMICITVKLLIESI